MIAEVIQGNREWLTIDQAVELTQISKSSLYKHLRDETFKSVSLRRPGTIRGRRLVSRSSIMAHLEGLTGEGYAATTS
jgi:hypothetical protein